MIKQYLRTRFLLKEVPFTFKVFKQSFKGQVNDAIQIDLNDMSVEVLTYEKGQKGYEVKRLSSWRTECQHDLNDLGVELKAT